MSLVAYDSSDDSSDGEQFSSTIKKVDDKTSSTTPKNINVQQNNNDTPVPGVLLFTQLPKPKSHIVENLIQEEGDVVPLKKEHQAKKDRGPVKIVLPSLSEFKDVEEDEKDRQKIMPSKKGTGLFAILPPPKTLQLKPRKPLIPHVLTKSFNKVPSQQIHNTKNPPKLTPKKTVKITKSNLEVSNNDSNSDNEDTPSDFFSLTKPMIEPLPFDTDFTIPDIPTCSKKNISELPNMLSSLDEKTVDVSVKKRLISTVMDLPKEEIVQKNKAEVGPKLPVPEQEFNIDESGNVAIDEKAIEYLCGKRGVKRKNKEFDEANVIEINGEDIKPDEREWLVKAMTSEPVQRPISMNSSGVNSQSKKKHQITYLAHQAKAMEVELKNQWAQNRMTRQQTQSKYGF